MSGALSVLSAQQGQIITNGLQLWLEPNLYASYPGTGIYCYDLSNNRATTTLVRSVGFSTARAPSFTFDGATNRKYIDVGGYYSYNTFTISSWFKSSSTATFQMLFSKETTSGRPWNYRLWLEITTGKLRGDTADAAVSSENLQSTAGYCDGVWHNAVFVRDATGGNLYLYADGTQVATTATTLGSVVNNQNVWIGLSAFTGENALGSYPVNGNIGQSLIYNRALSESEVQQNFRTMRGVYGV
jgi:hypothetical protein